MNMSELFKNRKPSDIRIAQMLFMERNENIKALNVAIGNVSLPMYPKMIERMHNLKENSDFANGVVKYTPTVGNKETRDAFLNIISSSGFSVDNLYVHVVDGGSMAMELVLLGVNGPVLLIDAAYTNYTSLAKRIGKKTISIKRHLHEHGKFSLPEFDEIEKIIKEEKPGAMVVIPYDNPTGHFYDHETMEKLGNLCEKYDMWMISDEAYRELHYVDSPASSIWALDIKGRRISIETASKVWNACGLRIGALVTDNKEFHEKAVAEATANLCAPAIDQYIFGALAHESHDDLRKWYMKQRDYYSKMMRMVTEKFKEIMPGIIVSSPDASLYSVIDMRNIDKGFNAKDFVLYCAKEGKVSIDGMDMTLLVAPMEGFYSDKENNPGRTQMRIAYVLPEEEMKLVPLAFKKLYENYASSIR